LCCSRLPSAGLGQVGNRGRIAGGEHLGVTGHLQIGCTVIRPFSVGGRRSWISGAPVTPVTEAIVRVSMRESSLNTT